MIRLLDIEGIPIREGAKTYTGMVWLIFEEDGRRRRMTLKPGATATALRWMERGA